MEKVFELGSEFHLDLDELTKKEKTIFDFLGNHQAFWTDSGRSAIRLVQMALDCKKVLLPEFICESVIRCFDSDSIEFYHIDENFHIDVDDLFAKMNDGVGLVYICHYFGYVQDRKALKVVQEKAKQLEIQILEDTTQSFFSEHESIGNYMIASIRKWFPISNGGVLYTKDDDNRVSDILCAKRIITSSDNDRANGMVLKKLYLEQRYDTNLMYREIFRKAEERIDQEKEIKAISDFSGFVLNCIDVDELIAQRKKNAKYLIEGLDKMGLAFFRPFQKEECPFVVPIRVKNRDNFREYLISKRIFCAVHWPFYDMKTKNRVQSKMNAKQLLSLPIDQRYDIEDIDYMLRVIGDYGGDLLF